MYSLFIYMMLLHFLDSFMGHQFKKRKKEMIIFIFLLNCLNKTFSQTLSNLSKLEYLLITPSLSLLQNTKKNQG